MRAGRLDRLVTIQRKTVTQDEYGQEVEAWTTLVARCPASYSSVRSEERFTADQFAAREQVEFRIRYFGDVSALNSLDRIIYPALESEDSPPEIPSSDRIYDIMGVPEIGRREGLRILAARRSEQST